MRSQAVPGLDRNASEVPRQQVVGDREPLARCEIWERAAEPVLGALASRAARAHGTRSERRREESSGIGSRPSVRRVATSLLESAAPTQPPKRAGGSCERPPRGRGARAACRGRRARRCRSPARSSCSRAARAPRRRRDTSRRSRGARTGGPSPPRVEAIVRANRARVRTATRGIAARTRLAASAPCESVTFDVPPARAARLSARSQSARARRARARPSPARAAARDRAARRRRRRDSRAARASRQVTPPVEWTSTSAAASRSLIESVKPSTRTRGSPANAVSSRRASRRVASGETDHGRVEFERRRHGSREVAHAPAAAGDDDDRPARSAGRARAGPRRTPAARGTPEPRAATRDDALPSPATRSTSGTRLSCITRCRSTPLSAQSSRPAKSVIVAHAGTSTLPRRRREPRISVAGGQVETTTSGEPRRTSRSTEREPASESAARASHRSRRLRRSAPEEQPEEPRRGVQLPAVGVAQEPAQRRRELGQHVADRHLARSGSASRGPRRERAQPPRAPRRQAP